MKKQIQDVHTGHCCLDHGCKYGNKNCTVVTKKALQEYRCEACDYYDEESEPLQKVLHQMFMKYSFDPKATKVLRELEKKLIKKRILFAAPKMQ